MDFFALLFSLTALFLSTFLSLYFRRKDKRNTQLQTLKNFINTAISNMSAHFHEKEKELKDKTIGLDISLKKLDRAGEFINNKLALIQDYLKQVENLQKELGADVREARSFQTELDQVKEKIKGFANVDQEIKTLRGGLSEAKKESALIKKDIEQTRIWAQDNLTDFVKKSEDKLKNHDAEMERAISERLENLEQSMAEKAEDLSYQASKLDQKSEDLRSRMDSFEKEISADIEESGSRQLEQAAKYKEALSASLFEFEQRWNGTVERIEKLHSEMSAQAEELKFVANNKERELKKQLETMELSLKEKYHDFEVEFGRKLRDKNAEFDESMIKLQKNLEERVGRVAGQIEKSLGEQESRLKNVLEEKIQEIDTKAGLLLKDFEERKSIMSDKFESMSQNMEQQFDRLESEYKEKTSGIEMRFKKITGEIEKVESRIQKEAADLFERAHRELSSMVDEFRKNAELKAKEKIDTVDERMREQLKKLEEGVNSNIRTFNGKIRETAGAINGLNAKLTGFIKEHSRDFQDEIANLKKSYTSEANRFMEEIGNREQKMAEMAADLNQIIHQASERILNEAEKAGDSVLERVKEREKEIYDNLEESSGLISDRLSQLDRSIASFEGEIKENLNLLGSEVDTRLHEYGERIEKLRELSDNMEGEIEKTVADRSREISKELEKIKNAFIEDYKQMIGNTKEDMEAIQSRLEELEQKSIEQKDLVLDGVKHSLNEFREWSLNEVAGIRDEIESAKMRTDGVLVDIQDRIDEHKEKVQDSEKRIKNGIKKLEETIQSIENNAESNLKVVESKYDKMVGLLGKLEKEIEAAKPEIDQNLKDYFEELKSESYRMMREFNGEREKVTELYYKDQRQSFKKEIDDFKNSFIPPRESILQEMQIEKQRVIDQVKKYSEEYLNQYNKVLSLLEQTDQNIKDVRTASFENLTKETENLQEKFERALGQAINKMKEDFNASEHGILERTDYLNKEVSSLQKVLDKVKKDTDDELHGMESEYKQMNELLNTLKNELFELKPNVESKVNELFNKLSEESTILLKEHSDKKLRDMENELNKKQTELVSEIARFKESMIPPREEIIEKMQQVKQDFAGKMNTYLESSRKEFESLLERMDEMKTGLNQTETQAIIALKEKAEQAQEKIIAKLNGVSRDFDQYIKKSESDFYQTVDDVRKQTADLFEELKKMRGETRENTIKDIKDLTRQSREIENRLDQLLKKSNVLERAEKMAEKSDNNIERISAYLKELEQQRKELESALKNLEAVRGESQAVQSMLSEVVRNKQEAVRLADLISGAMEKARDTQALLDVIVEQQAKAEKTKTLLMDTLKTFEDLKTQMASLENKKKVINDLMSRVDNAENGLGDVNDKMNTLEGRISMMNKESKRVEQEIRAARNNIDNLFKEQDKVSSAVNKISDIENLFYHIEEEEKKINRMREWIAAAQTELEHMREAHQSVMPDHGRGTKNADEETVKNVLRLKDQGWQVNEIARSLKISRAYVELILERYED